MNECYLAGELFTLGMCSISYVKSPCARRKDVFKHIMMHIYTHYADIVSVFKRKWVVYERFQTIKIG